MKRALALFGILIISAALLAGCGNDQYSIEKQFWYAGKQADAIFANPHATPPNELQRVIGTREPTEMQLEVGRAALEEILRVEGLAA
jgi:uncharacterized protein YqhQ